MDTKLNKNNGNNGDGYGGEESNEDWNKSGD